MRDPILFAVAGLFLVILIVRLVRGVAMGRRLSRSETCLPEDAVPEIRAIVEEARKPGKAKEALRTVERKAASTESSVARAEYHCAAGAIALQVLKRPPLAVGFYLRALREDPSCIRALDALARILTESKRLRRLERTYWEVLGRLDDSETGTEIWARCWSGLAALYSRTPRTVKRADAIRKMLADSMGDAEGQDASTPREEAQ